MQEPTHPALAQARAEGAELETPQIAELTARTGLCPKCGDFVLKCENDVWVNQGVHPGAPLSIAKVMGKIIAIELPGHPTGCNYHIHQPEQA